MGISEEKLQIDVNLVREKSDNRAFTRIYNLFYSQLFSISLYYTHSPVLSEEVVSDVFVKLWNKRAEINQIKKLKSYLFVAVKNQSLNYIHKYKKHRSLDVYEYSGDDLGFEESVEVKYLKQEFESHVENAVGNLPDRCRQVYTMVRVDRQKHKEVSNELGISTKTIEAQIGIAVKKLTRELSWYVK